MLIVNYLTSDSHAGNHQNKMVPDLNLYLKAIYVRIPADNFH